MNKDLSIQTVSRDCVFNPFFAIEDSQQAGFVWFADQSRGFKYIENVTAENCREVSYNSPFSHHVKEITIGNDELWIASGNLNPTFSPLFRADGIFRLKEGRWTEYGRRAGGLEGKEVWDFMDVAIHPQNGTVYAAAFIEGLIEFDGDNFTIYDDSNSSLNNAIGDENRTRVSGLAFDDQNNLWVSNYSAERPLSVRTSEGEWQSFSTASGCQSQNTLLDIVVDPFGYKWIVTASNNAGILIYDSGTDLLDPSDDRCRLLTSSNTELPTNQVNTITLDNDGSIWVGTSEGVAVSQGFDPFDANFNFFLPKTDQDANNLGLLLKSEEVRTIAVDGANRKWFGTSSGIFVQSPDGTEQLARFTIDNSPLFDNTILDIEIEPESGEVFIGTTKGLLSYKGEATEGGSFNRSDAYAYPNPVRPEYQGPIAIKGLATDANVKITDVHGQLIFETTALGGQAIWNGNNYNGTRAKAGVYLVFATSNNTFQPDAIVTKILIVN